jgi:hypothetical protein
MTNRTPRVTQRHTDNLILMLKNQRRLDRRDQTVYSALVLYVLLVGAPFLAMALTYPKWVLPLIATLIGVMVCVNLFFAAQANWNENEAIDIQRAVHREWAA